MELIFKKMSKKNARLAKRRATIATEFPSLAQKYIGDQGLSPERVLEAMARKFKTTVPGIKYILQREGLYENNRQLRETYSN